MEWWSHLTLRGIDASSNGDILASSPAMAVDSEDMWRLLLGANTVSYMQLLKSSDDPACDLRCGLGWMFFEIQLTFLEVCTPESKHPRGKPGIEMDSFILGSHIWGIGWFLSMFFFPRTGQLHISSYIPKSAISIYFNGTHENTSRSSSTSFQDLGLPHDKSSIAAEISRRSSRAKTPGVGNRPRLKGEGDGVASEQHGVLFGWFQHALGMVYFYGLRWFKFNRFFDHGHIWTFLKRCFFDMCRRWTSMECGGYGQTANSLFFCFKWNAGGEAGEAINWERP